MAAAALFAAAALMLNAYVMRRKEAKEEDT
jgi:hypothetical protein